MRDADSDAELVQPEDRTAIPTHYYKILTRDLPNQRIDTLTIMLEHVDASPTGATPCVISSCSTTPKQSTPSKR